MQNLRITSIALIIYSWNELILFANFKNGLILSDVKALKIPLILGTKWSHYNRNDPKHTFISNLWMTWRLHKTINVIQPPNENVIQTDIYSSSTYSSMNNKLIK